MMQSEDEYGFTREYLRNRNLVIVLVLVAVVKSKLPIVTKLAVIILSHHVSILLEQVCCKLLTACFKILKQLGRSNNFKQQLVKSLDTTSL